MAGKNKILVVGSLAYDHLMTYEGYFKDVIVPKNYNIALTTNQRNIFFGGCSGNIAYNLRLLGQEPMLLTVAGKDFAEYRNWLTDQGVDISAVYEANKHYTAAAFIVTDKNQNQITTFDAGAMNAVATSQSLKKLAHQSIAWAIIAPDNPVRMMKFAKECKELRIPFIFDPAQEINHIEPEELRSTIKNAAILIVNEYEAQLLARRTGMTSEEIRASVPVYIETRGEKGCSVKWRDGTEVVPDVRPLHLVDTTGCGDAFRAGVLAGLMKQYSIKKCCRMGALLATYNLEQNGTQNHRFTMKEFAMRFENNFGDKL